MVETTQKLAPFTVVKYQTKDGENITATKKDGVVTLDGDVNGVRQMPLEQFLKELPEVLPQLERTPDKDEVAFQGKKNKKDKDLAPEEYFKEYKVKAGSAKKAGVAIASAIIPGLGQAINDDWGRGFAHFFGDLALQIAAGVSIMAAGAGKKLGLVGAVAAGAGYVANRVVAAVNAAKNATETIRVETNKLK